VSHQTSAQMLTPSVQRRQIDQPVLPPPPPPDASVDLATSTATNDVVRIIYYLSLYCIFLL